MSSFDFGWIAGPLAFLVTDIDDLVVLVAFFAEAAIRPRSVILGQFAGIAFLLAASALALILRLVVPVGAVGLLGLLPLILGIRAALELASARRAAGRQDGAGPAADRPARPPGALGVALVTVANGGDNVAIYAPLFASSSLVRAAGLAGIFLAMTGLWLGLAWITVHNPLFGRHLQKWGRWLLPPVLILLGLWILWKNGTVAWLAGLAASAMPR